MLAFLIIFLHIYQCNSKCIQFTYPYEDKCYVFLRPHHVRTFREVRWKETLQPKEKDTTANLSMAEKACSQLHEILPPKPSFVHSFEFDQIQAISTINPKLNPKVATVRDIDHLKYLRQKAYGTSAKRSGGSALVLGNKTASSPLANSSGNTKNGYNKGDCAYLFFDGTSSSNNLGSLIWVDCSNPYDQSLDLVDASHTIICEYDRPPDCVMKPIYDKCRVTQWGACLFDQFYSKIPGDPVYGTKCQDAKNETIVCPEYKESECYTDCQWSEWTMHRKCTCVRGRGKEMLTRKRIQKEFGIGKDCQGDVDLIRQCDCRGERIVVIGWIMLVGLVLIHWIMTVNY